MGKGGEGRSDANMTERDGEPSVESAEARRRGAAYEQPRWRRAREREEATKIRYGAWHLASAACGDGQSGRGRRSVVWLWRVCGGSVPCPLCPRVPREARVPCATASGAHECRDSLAVCEACARVSVVCAVSVGERCRLGTVIHHFPRPPTPTPRRPNKSHAHPATSVLLATSKKTPPTPSHATC